MRLIAGSGGGGGRLRVRIGDADVSADLVLANLVDDYFFRYMRAGDIEENRLVEGAVLYLEALVLDGHSQIDLVLLLVDALELDSDVADLLGLVLACDGEFDVLALAEAAELVDFIMVARDESAHLALGHLQLFLGAVEVGADGRNLGVDVLYVVSRGFGGQFRVDRRVESAELLRRLVVLFRGCFRL